MDRAKGIHSDWIRNLPESERAEFEKALRNNGFILNRLIDILYERLGSVDRAEINREQYESPSWAYWQAHQNGRREGLTEVLSLLSFLDQRS